MNLRDATHYLEDSIITLSGPALAISGIIAGVDLLTGGHILQQIWWLSLAWAICLLLTLDFQVLSLGARSHKVYLSSEKSTRRKVFEIVLAVVVAGAISYVSVQMQSIIARSNGAGLSIEQATMQLGINPIALIWERSALVLVLIFMSGWFREEQVKQAVSVETPSTISEDVMSIILEKLQKLDLLEQAIAAQSVTVNQVQEQLLLLPETAGVSSEAESDGASLQAAIAGVLVDSPTLSSREIAERLQRPHTTVYRAINKMKQEVKQ
jgi:hypothetical protein